MNPSDVTAGSIKNPTTCTPAAFPATGAGTQLAIATVNTPATTPTSGTCSSFTSAYAGLPVNITGTVTAIWTPVFGFPTYSVTAGFHVVTCAHLRRPHAASSPVRAPASPSPGASRVPQAAG